MNMKKRKQVLKYNLNSNKYLLKIKIYIKTVFKKKYKKIHIKI